MFIVVYGCIIYIYIFIYRKMYTDLFSEDASLQISPGGISCPACVVGASDAPHVFPRRQAAQSTVQWVSFRVYGFGLRGLGLRA